MIDISGSQRIWFIEICSMPGTLTCDVFIKFIDRMF